MVCDTPFFPNANYVSDDKQDTNSRKCWYLLLGVGLFTKNEEDNLEDNSPAVSESVPSSHARDRPTSAPRVPHPLKTSPPPTGRNTKGQASAWAQAGQAQQPALRANTVQPKRAAAIIVKLEDRASDTTKRSKASPRHQAPAPHATQDAALDDSPPESSPVPTCKRSLRAVTSMPLAATKRARGRPAISTSQGTRALPASAASVSSLSSILSISSASLASLVPTPPPAAPRTSTRSKTASAAPAPHARSPRLLPAPAGRAPLPRGSQFTVSASGHGSVSNAHASGSNGRTSGSNMRTLNAHSSGSSASAMGSSASALGAGVPLLLYNSAKRTLYKDAELAVREMALTDVVQVLECEDLVAHCAGKKAV
ncbi:hypothetical protein C8R44DRAFT_874270 [Mycena epipterygia]|nr:hypothetical protein C8R44DRAFT_874270 [Mycena epipterygia]